MCSSPGRIADEGKSKNVNRGCVEAQAISPLEFTFIVSRSHLKTMSHDCVMCVIAYV